MRAFVIAVGFVGLVLGSLGIAWLLSSQNGDYVFDLNIGDCFAEPTEWSDGGGEEVTEVDVIGCDQPHDAEVVGVGTLNDEGTREYPSDDALFAEIDQRCGELDNVPTERFGVVPVAPTEVTWSALDGKYLCIALPYGGARTVGAVSD